MKENFEKKLFAIIDKEKVLLDEPMKKHTTFRIGGPADYFIVPSEVEEIKAVVSLCEETGMPYYVIGNGSNLLVKDNGIRGIVIMLNMDKIEIEDTIVTVEAGVKLGFLAQKLLK